jgi:hypothetical protein
MSLTSPMTAWDRLQNLKKTDPQFWEELTANLVPAPANTDNTHDKDNMDKPDAAFGDDSDLLCEVVMVHVINVVIPDGVTATADGNLISAAKAESMEDVGDSKPSEPVMDDAPVAEELGLGK